MKSLAIVSFFFASVAMAAATPNLKVAYVDLQQALQSVDAGKKAKGQLEKDVASKKAELEKSRRPFRRKPRSSRRRPPF